MRKLVIVVTSALALSTSVARAGDIVAFGDSQLDTRRLCSLISVGHTACSNGAGVLEYLPQYTQLRFAHALNYAVGGAGSGDGTFDLSAYRIPGVFSQTNSQVTEFLADGRTIAPDDVLVFSALTNNHTRLDADPALTGEQLAMDTLNENLTSLTRLVDAGARNMVVYGGGDVSTIFGAGETAAMIEKQRIFGTLYAEDLPASLRPLAERGVQIRVFDRLTLYPRIAADPQTYGFENGSDQCSTDPACRGASVAEQNKHFLWDIHPTTAGFELLARYIANLLGAQDEIPLQGQLMRQQAQSFSASVVDRLPTTADGIENASPISLYAYYLHSWADGESGVDSAIGGSGRSASSRASGGVVGLDYRAMPGVTLGGAVGKTKGSGRYASGNDTSVDLLQVSAYGSLVQNNWHVTGAVTLGRSDIDVARAGVVDRLMASPDGSTVTATVRGGYMFGAGMLKIGPVGQLDYLHATIDGYTESGDSVLTQSVHAQTFDMLTGSIGIRAEVPVSVGGVRVQPYGEISAAHHFNDGGRVLTTEQTSAPGLPIHTDIAGQGHDTYGRLAVGASVAVAQAAALFTNVGTTVGQDGGNATYASMGLTIRF